MIATIPVMFILATGACIFFRYLDNLRFYDNNNEIVHKDNIHYNVVYSTFVVAYIITWVFANKFEHHMFFLLFLGLTLVNIYCFGFLCKTLHDMKKAKTYYENLYTSYFSLIFLLIDIIGTIMLTLHYFDVFDNTYVKEIGIIFISFGSLSVFFMSLKYIKIKK
jgi:Na+-transporting NADH:ubiquinone oxidoreductase subunit NqrE